MNARENTITVERKDGQSVTYDPRRLRGVNVYRKVPREFAIGDRLQFSAPNKKLGLANRDIGTVTGINDTRMSVKLDGYSQRTVSFDAEEFRQFDHGYAVTSHSSQGLTAGRVLANFDTDSSRNLINTRLAYVAISRASDDARVYTNNAETLGQRLATDISKTSAVDFREQSPTEQTRQAVAAFRSNDPATATELLQQQSRVHEYANSEHRLAAVALDYTTRADRAVIVAPDAAERHELTQLIRAELQAQGRLSTEILSVPILVGQHLSNLRLVSNYASGDEIRYRAGSPAEHGIADNSTATVLSVDLRANAFTVVTRDGNEVSYNPALLKKQTGQSAVYREEQRDLALGERVQFTAFDREAHIRCGDFATVERIGNDNTLSLRLDSGKSIELSSDKAQHIEYGYAVETAHHAAVDRILVTGDAGLLAQQQEALTRLSAHTRDLALYTSDRSALVMEKAAPGAEIGAAQNLPLLGVGNISKPSAPTIELEGFGIGL